jgi:hypothetical protein
VTRLAHPWTNVRFESFATVWLRTADFRSTPVNGHRQVGSAGPFRARNGTHAV